MFLQIFVIIHTIFCADLVQDQELEKSLFGFWTSNTQDEVIDVQTQDTIPVNAPQESNLQLVPSKIADPVGKQTFPDPDPDELSEDLHDDAQQQNFDDDVDDEILDPDNDDPTPDEGYRVTRVFRTMKNKFYNWLAGDSEDKNDNVGAGLTFVNKNFFKKQKNNLFKKSD